MEAAIHVSDNTACIEGPGAEEFTTFYINGQKVNMSNGTVDLSAYNGKLDLKATSTYGGILKLTQWRLRLVYHLQTSLFLH